MPPSGSFFGGPFKRVNGVVVSQDPIVAPSIRASGGAAGDIALGQRGRYYPASVSRRISSNAQTGTLARTVVDTRCRLIIPAGPGMVRFLFRNCGIDGVQLVETTNLANVGTITLNAVLYDGFDNYWSRLYFCGRGVVEIAPGGIAISDPIAYSAKNNDLVRIKTHVVATGGYVPAMPIEAGDGYSVDGTDRTGVSGSTGYTAGPGYGYVPCCALTDAPQNAIFACGDSITDGVGDSGFLKQYDSYLTQGWIRRACVLAGIGGYVRGYPGGMASQYDYQYNPVLGQELAQIGAAKCVFAFGTNDCLYRTFAQMKTDFVRAFAKLRGMGFSRIYCPLILPQTASTDGWVTEANQTPKAGFEGGGTRDQMNAWLLAGADGQIAGTMDTLTGVANGSVWLPRMTDDGVHPAGKSSEDPAVTGNACAIMAANNAAIFAA